MVQQYAHGLIKLAILNGHASQVGHINLVN
jgi:hypothetical protein